MSRQVPLPIPIAGLNTINPFLPIEAGFARELTNYSIYNGELVIRPGVVTELNAARTDVLHWIYKSAGVWYGIYQATGDIRNVTANSGAGGTGAACQAVATTVKHVSLNLLIGAAIPRDQAYPFTAWTFTTGTITSANISSACSHKGRLYVAEKAITARVEYSSIGQITGAMLAAVSFAEFLDGQTILRMFSVTAQPGNYSENVFVIFGTGGRVLVYQGDYPASTTWSLIGKYDMPAPVGAAGFVEKDGDIFVATNLYAYWFRDLFQSGAQTAYEKSPTRPIENLWTLCFWDGSVSTTEYAKAFYYQPLDAIICQCSEKSTAGLNLIANYVNESCYFVYFRKYKAWALWLSAPMFGPSVTYDNSTYYFTGYSGRIKSMAGPAGTLTDTTDTPTTLSIETSWKTSYISPFAGKIQAVRGIRPYFFNTASGYFDKIRIIFDYSDYNATYGFFTQSTVAQVNPGNYADGQIDVPAVTYQQYHDRLDVPGLGGGVSIQFSMKKKSSASATGVQALYAATAYIDDGGEYNN